MRSLGPVPRRVTSSAWKLIGMAGVAGVAATGVVVARNERRRRTYTPDEIRDRLHTRHGEALDASICVAAEPEVRGEGAAGRVRHEPDPVAVAGFETQAWAGYYHRRWGRVLRGALGMVREGFGTGPAQTARAAWWVLRANQAWAPFPDNDPDAARGFMARFYRIAAAAQDLQLDPDEAARLEVAWWQVHRDLQRVDPTVGDERLVIALTALYAHVYSVDPERVAPAARHRSAAMAISDEWVAGGCRDDDPRLAEVEARLVLSYGALRDALRS